MMSQEGKLNSKVYNKHELHGKAKSESRRMTATRAVGSTKCCQRERWKNYHQDGDYFS